MKKTITFISPLLVGLFSGCFVECSLCVASIVMSPFSTFEQSKFSVFCGIISLVSALIIIVVAIADVMLLIELDNKKKLKPALVLQTCATILVCFVSWYYAEQIIDALYYLF